MINTLATSISNDPSAGAVAFWLLAIVAGLSALGLVLTKNIVRAAVCLLFTLGSVAGIFLLLSAEFLAAVQIVVYVGGTLVLIIFGVMLTTNSPLARFQPTPLQAVLAGIVGVGALAALAIGVNRLPVPSAIATTLPANVDSVGAIGRLFLGPYLLVFELASIVLLVVMIGAAHLARGRTADDEQEEF